MTVTKADYTVALAGGAASGTDFIRADISRGFSQPLARVATVGRATIVLDNRDGTYSPLDGAGVNLQDSIELQADGETLFFGRVNRIQPESENTLRRVILQCVDDMERLDREQAEITPQTDVFADDIISATVSSVYTPTATNYEAGLNVFETSAADWHRQELGDALETVIASRKIEDACLSDWGRFFISRDGTPTFYNRHHIPSDTSTELTVNKSMTSMTYAIGLSTIYNYVRVTAYPRRSAEDQEVLARLDQDSPPLVDGNDSITLSLDYRDPADPRQPIGASAVTTPVADTDYACTTTEGANGGDGTSDVSASVTAYGDHVDVTLTNSSSDPRWVQRLQVRGYAIRAREPVTLIAEDATSQSSYGKRRLPIRAPLISNPINAQNLAEHLIDRYKDGLTEVENLVIDLNQDATTLANGLALDLLDRVSVTEDQTGLSAYLGHVYNLQHTITEHGFHTLTISLEEPYTFPGDPFTWGDSTWGGGDVWVY